MQVSWLDFQGDRRPFCRLDPGRRYLQHSFATHAWLFEDLQTQAVVSQVSLGTQDKQHLFIGAGEGRQATGPFDELDLSFRWAPALKFKGTTTDREITRTVAECDSLQALFLDDPIRTTAEESVQWMRPAEFRPDLPWAWTGTGTVEAGTMGLTGFLAALQVCAQNPVILRQCLVCPYPTLGLYVVRFYKNGAPVKVLIDDCLPVVNGVMLLSGSSSNLNELWVPLLEKAYAKLHGCYKALEAIPIQAALLDLTGSAPFIPSNAHSLRVTKEDDLTSPEGVEATLRAKQTASGLSPQLVVSTNSSDEVYDLLSCCWTPEGGQNIMLLRLQSYGRDPKAPPDPPLPSVPQVLLVSIAS